MNEKNKLYYSLVIPILFILLIWCIKIIEISFDNSFYFLGIYPLKIQGLIGIFTSPLIHSDWKHLVNNTVPFLILGTATFYFYRPIGLKIFILTWLMTGVWVWCGARDAWHIGASGIVYGLAAFLIISGVIRRIPELAAISLIVIFIYGSMIWGIFPFIPDISWESHLSGGIAGLILSFLYRKDGPQPKQYDLFDENEDQDEYPVSKEEQVLLEISKHNDESLPVDNQDCDEKEGKIVYLYKKNDENQAT